MGETGKSLNLDRGALSRLVATLTAEGYDDRPGMDLINRAVHVRDRRKKTLLLSERGRRVCEVLGVSMRGAALDSLDRYMELLAENSEAMVRVGIDAEHRVCVYLVSGLYLTGTYRQIVTSVSRNPEYRVGYNEITDLTGVQAFEMDDAGVQAGIAIEKSIAGLTRRRVFLAKDAKVLSRLQMIDAQFRNAGLDTFRFASSLDQAKEILQLPTDWQYPITSTLRM
jgi:DNA-binding MarR family transcriptional regulator